MQIDLKYALIGQLYEQTVVLAARVEELAKQNAEAKAEQQAEAGEETP